MIQRRELRWLAGDPRAVVDSRRRLALGAAAFALLLALVFARAVQLEVCYGAAFRAEARATRQLERPVPAPRGRILSADGVVLACDQPQPALAVAYRWLEEPPNARWLERTARAQLSRQERSDPARLEAAKAAVRAEKAAVAQRLQALCGLSAAEWRRRAEAIQRRVERIADDVARRRRATPEETAPPPQTVGQWIASAVRETAHPPRDPAEHVPLVVAEELDDHILVDALPPDAVAAIERDPSAFPGVAVVRPMRRVYPRHALAGHLLGYLGSPAANANEGEPLAGQAGLERAYDDVLRPHPGALRQRVDRRGRAISEEATLAPQRGADLHLTLDSRLQATAETLLDEAVARRAAFAADGPEPAGGAIVVLDVHRGDILALASAPRYDPNWFLNADRSQAVAALGDPARPLFDRAVQMALPPGSVFKTVAAVALLQTRTVDPRATIDCQGYLEHPDRLRCELFVRHGRGHGPVDLFAALAESCNVYFFTAADRLGGAALRLWAERFGFGAASGVDLPYESAGRLPAAEALSADARGGIDASRMFAVGQGALTATPLQVARMMAAVANGGALVTPHLVERIAPADESDSAARETLRTRLPTAAPRDIVALDPGALRAVRQGLAMVVADPLGTAHATVQLAAMPIAGKTGTAETAGGEPHAWFAGYAPADAPRVAFVVVIEHGGSGGAVAGPVARRLVERMQALGLLEPAK